MSEKRITPEVVQPKKWCMPYWLKFGLVLTPLLLSPVILYVLFLMLLGLFLGGNPLILLLA